MMWQFGVLKRSVRLAFQRSPKAIAAVLASIFAGLTLTSCQTSNDDLLRQLVAETPNTRDFFSGKTLVHLGMQVEYYRPDGAAFLWAPKNTVVVPGRWKVEGFVPGDTFSGDICFKYASTYEELLAGTASGFWECHELRSQKLIITGRVAGDPFNLSKTLAVPFVSSNWQTSLESLIKKYQRQLNNKSG
jgi:hypothetical protein